MIELGCLHSCFILPGSECCTSAASRAAKLRGLDSALSTPGRVQIAPCASGRLRLVWAYLLSFERLLTPELVSSVRIFFKRLLVPVVAACLGLLSRVHHTYQHAVFGRQHASNMRQHASTCVNTRQHVTLRKHRFPRIKDLRRLVSRRSRRGAQESFIRGKRCLRSVTC